MVGYLTTKCYWCWRVRWRVTHHSECSAHCGPGKRNVTIQCQKESLQQPSVSTPVDDRLCKHLNTQPPEAEPCEGTCKDAHWQFHPWSQVRSIDYNPIVEWLGGDCLFILPSRCVTIVFANVRRRNSNTEGPLCRYQWPDDFRYSLPSGRENPAPKLPRGELPTMGSRRMDAGKSIVLTNQMSVWHWL